MEFTAYHGVYDVERKTGNRFTVDIQFEADTLQAQSSDDLNDTVDYSKIYQLVATEMQQPSQLLEHVAQRIKSSIEGNMRGVGGLQVAVTKHNPPVDGKVEKVTVVL